MKKTFSLFAACLVFAGQAAAADLAPGDAAPLWTLAGSDGQQHSLAELRGRHVVVAFFPKAFTGG